MRPRAATDRAQGSTTLRGVEVHVWYRRTGALSDAARQAHQARLSDGERQRCARLICGDDRRDWAAAHALVRECLARYDGRPAAAWRFVSASRGKPRVAADQAGDPPLTFNLSHTAGLVACAIARGGEVGIDVERVDRLVDRDAVADSTCSAGELAMLRATPPRLAPVRFIELWTLKEAYIKADGGGLSLALASVGFRRDGQRLDFDGPRHPRYPLERFALIAPAAGYRLAIAVLARAGDAECRITLADADDPSCGDAALLAGSNDIAMQFEAAPVARSRTPRADERCSLARLSRASRQP